MRLHPWEGCLARVLKVRDMGATVVLMDGSETRVYADSGVVDVVVSDNIGRMRLWILRSKRSGGYDTTNGFVVCAKNEKAARAIAASGERGEEHIWTNAENSSCEVLTTADGEGVIMRDFNAG